MKGSAHIQLLLYLCQKLRCCCWCVKSCAAAAVVSTLTNAKGTHVVAAAHDGHKGMPHRAVRPDRHDVSVRLLQRQLYVNGCTALSGTGLYEEWRRAPRAGVYTQGKGESGACCRLARLARTMGGATLGECLFAGR